MSFLKTYEHIIKNSMSKLKKEVVIRIFTDVKQIEDGKKVRQCMSCETIMILLNAMVEFSDGKLIIEEYSINDNEDIAKSYKIKRIPTILFIDEDENELIRYMASPLGSETSPFIETILFFSGADTYFNDLIKENLPKMEETEIKIFITQSCPYCPQVVSTVNKFAIASNGKIKSNIIDIDANPELAELYGVYSVPHSVFNEKKTIGGMYSAQNLLEFLTKGKSEVEGGMYT